MYHWLITLHDIDHYDAAELVRKKAVALRDSFVYSNESVMQKTITTPSRARLRWKNIIQIIGGWFWVLTGQSTNQRNRRLGGINKNTSDNKKNIDTAYPCLYIRDLYFSSTLRQRKYKHLSSSLYGKNNKICREFKVLDKRV